MPITHKATLPLYRPGEPSFVQKLDYRFDVPADHLVRSFKEKKFSFRKKVKYFN